MVHFNSLNASDALGLSILPEKTCFQGVWKEISNIIRVRVNAFTSPHSVFWEDHRAFLKGKFVCFAHSLRHFYFSWFTLFSTRTNFSCLFVWQMWMSKCMFFFLLLFMYYFFSIWVFFHNHLRITGLQGKGEGISLNACFFGFFTIIIIIIFFLSGFSFTTIYESQDCKGRERAFL